MVAKHSENKSEVTRPLPATDEMDTAAFWQSTNNQLFTYQQCTHCNTIVWHPRAHCTGCTNSNLQWRESAGKGEIYTYSVVRQSYHPFFRSRVPYAVVYVDLDEGPRLLTNMVGIEDPLLDISIGMRVQLHWEVHDTLCIPLVEPVAD
ncbi:MAG: Zn-ribbon domain-containing OB-fold protein [bacterium]